MIPVYTSNSDWPEQRKGLLNYIYTTRQFFENEDQCQSLDVTQSINPFSNRVTTELVALHRHCYNLKNI